MTAATNGNGNGAGTDTLVLEGIVKRFGSVTALRGATIRARTGEVTAIVGDNGAGKSTLIKCLTGVHHPDEGRIMVDGEEVHFHSPEDSRGAGIEAVYQDLALADDLAVWQNLYLNRELTRGVGPLRLLDRKRMRREADAMVRTLSVNVPPVRSRVRRLSGGQRQAVAICRAAGFGSRIVIMDEPTAALGHRETHRAEELIASLRDRGLAVLLISHDFAQVQRLAQRVWVMRGGRVTASLGANDVSTERLVAMVTGAEED
jgi:simple sugar transport system ATP-binding protein